MTRTLTNPEDHASLWDAFRHGSREAFSGIYELFAPELYRYGYNLVREKVLVEDCIHELFLYLYTKRENLGPTDNIRFYLYKAIRSRLLNAVKNRKNVQPSCDYVFDKAEFLIQPVEKTLIEQQFDALRHRIIVQELNKLPKRQKEILYLVYINGLSYPEAAETMGITLKSVYNTVHIALGTLKRYLKAYVHHEGFFASLALLFMPAAPLLDKIHAL